MMLSINKKSLLLLLLLSNSTHMVFSIFNWNLARFRASFFLLINLLVFLMMFRVCSPKLMIFLSALGCYILYSSLTS
ncbi:hypothetical protein Leryth_000606 [Lithospermum erythrorhizon]|nr:hypothetical protein Leryth_000606 [Lithospermum erythrorhizon]